MANEANASINTTVVNPKPHSICFYHKKDIERMFGDDFDHMLREIALNGAQNVVCNPYVTADDLERALDVLVQLRYEQQEVS